MRIVDFQGQQFLLIGSKVVIGLEGARLAEEFSAYGAGGGEEAHFWSMTSAAGRFPSAIFGQPSAAFVDDGNVVPWSAYAARDDSLARQSGNGTATGSSGDDYIWAWRPVGTSDSISGGLGNDVIDANSGRDLVRGGGGDDLIAGGIDRDQLFGDSGHDALWGGAQADKLYGGDGNDRLQGSSGHDLAFGGNGHDSLQGNGGADTSHGDAGNDVLVGGAGNDTLRGGPGRDSLTGQAGDDVFVFAAGEMTQWDGTAGTVEARTAQLDVIVDFVPGEDRIAFTGIAGAAQIADFAVWRLDQGDHVAFVMHLPGSAERILVRVAEGVTWQQFTAPGNFLFD